MGEETDEASSWGELREREDMGVQETHVELNL